MSKNKLGCKILCKNVEKLNFHFFLIRQSTYNTIHMNILLAFNLFKILIYLHSLMCVCMLRSIFYVKIPLKIMFYFKSFIFESHLHSTSTYDFYFTELPQRLQLLQNQRFLDFFYHLET